MGTLVVGLPPSSIVNLPEASGQYLNIFPYSSLATSLSKMILGIHFATELSGNFFWVIGVSLLSWRQSIALPIAESSSEKSGVFREDLFRSNEPPQSFCLTFPALLCNRLLRAIPTVFSASEFPASILELID